MLRSQRFLRHGLAAALATIALLGGTQPAGAQSADPAPVPRRDTPPLPAAPAAAPPAQDLGDRDKDLVFVPVTPCRLADSRNATDPNYRRFAANATKSYNFLERTDYSAYGGQSTPCNPALPFYGAGATGFEPEALALNITVAGPDAPGFLRAFPFGTAVTPASNLNWSAGQIVANSAIVRICNFCGPDLSVKIDGSGTADVIIDVFGYFIATPPATLDSYIATISRTNISGSATLETAACNAGYRITGGGFWTSLGDVFVTKSAPNTSGTAWGIDTYRGLDVYTAIAYEICARVPGRTRA